MYLFDLTISDGYESTVKTLSVTVYNLPPVFDTTLTPPGAFSVKLNSVLNINPLPQRHDPEGMPMSTTFMAFFFNLWQPLPSFITTNNAKTSMRIAPTKFVEVGIWQIKMILDDYNLQTEYQFQLEVTNSAPYLADLPDFVSLYVRESVEYFLPDKVDDESNPIFTSIYIGKNKSPLPSFMSIAADQNSIVVSPTKKAHIGTYIITVFLTDTQLSSKTNFAIQVLKPLIQFASLFNIGPPVYTRQLEDIQLLGGSENATIELPLIIDPDEDEYTQAFSLGEAFTFIALSADSSYLMIKPEVYNGGSYQISIIL